MGQKIQAVKGMNDLLPVEQKDFKLTAAFWQTFENRIGQWAHRFGYRQIRTPIVEQTGLFVRSIGEDTDVVGKEMYTFADSNDTLSLSLRPEGTASCLRAVVEHNLLYNGGQKLWYMGPMFRRERPQKGRYRQFHQVGVEALGFEGPDIDAEIIAMCADLWRELGISQYLTLEINSLGNREERAAHRAALVGYLKQHEAALDEDSKKSATAPRAWPIISVKPPAPTTPVSKPCSTAWASPMWKTTASCAGWTTTTKPCSNGPPTNSAPKPPCAAAAATTA